MNFIKIYIYLTVSILFFAVGFSQNNVPFKIRYQSNVKGDMTVIANNITNRIDENNNGNIPSNNKINTPKNKENFEIGYIDIDNDDNTFSSSSATLNLANQSNKKIIYAGLYWSATYKYARGVKSPEGEYIAQNNTREAFDKIKIKFPNQENYTDITGEIIFDGINDKKCQEDAPYVAFADITNEVAKLQNPFGEYTVANVKATLGSLPEGVASGWTLFFVYEDQQMPNKYVVSMDGFSKLSKKATKIQFTGFESLPEGTVNANFAFAALEGDNSLKSDQILFKKAAKNRYVAFDDLLRNQDNIFNSSATINNDYISNRNPNSNNTLGYNTFLMSVPNPENTIIANNSKELNLKFISKKDNCYLFFTAFNVEIKEQIFKVKSIQNSEKESVVIENNIPAKTDSAVLAPIGSKGSIADASTNLAKETTAIQLKQSTQTTLVTENEKPKPTPKNEIKGSENSQNKIGNTIENSQETISTKQYFNYDIAGVAQGYYIIVNVFAKEKNRTNFVKLLRSKGFNASSFYNPTKKYYYVFIEESHNKTEIQDLYNSKINNLYTDDMWILAVNNPSATESYTDNSKIEVKQKGNKKASPSYNKVSKISQYYKKPDLIEHNV